jgi:hypothetical protein
MLVSDAISDYFVQRWATADRTNTGRSSLYLLPVVYKEATGTAYSYGNLEPLFSPTLHVT